MEWGRPESACRFCIKKDVPGPLGVFLDVWLVLCIPKPPTTFERNHWNHLNYISVFFGKASKKTDCRWEVDNQ